MNKGHDSGCRRRNDVKTTQRARRRSSESRLPNEAVSRRHSNHDDLGQLFTPPAMEYLKDLEQITNLSKEIAPSQVKMLRDDIGQLSAVDVSRFSKQLAVNQGHKYRSWTEEAAKHASSDVYCGV